MNSSNVVVKTTNTINDDFFLCRVFAKAISADKFLQLIEQQTTNESDILIKDDKQMTVHSSNIQWKLGDSCLCPYNEDGLLYKATIVNLSSSTCTVLFDDYGNEEIHPLTDLQIQTEQQQSSTINEDDILPSAPPFPRLNFNEENDSLSSTLMSWYLAGYHTGFYQGIKNRKDI